MDNIKIREDFEIYQESNGDIIFEDPKGYDCWIRIHKSEIPRIIEILQKSAKL